MQYADGRPDGVGEPEFEWDDFATGDFETGDDGYI